MREQKTYDELSDEVERLRDEEQRLRDELRRHLEASKAADGEHKVDEKPPKPDEEKKPEEAAKRPGDKKDAGDKEENKPKPPLRARLRDFVARHPFGVLIGAVAFVVLLIGGILLWNYLESYQSTDDAEIDGHVNNIGPRVSGTVTAVYIEDNQPVKAGQLLVELDARDYQTALEQAQGAYQQALAELEAANPNVPITETTSRTAISTSQADVIAGQKGVAAAEQTMETRQADLRQAQAQNEKAQRDVTRYQSLVVKEEVSREQFDAVVAAAKSQAAAVDAAAAAVREAERNVEQRKAQLLEAESRLSEAQRNAPRQVAIRQADITTRKANVVAAKGQLDQAQLNVSYTQIHAAVDGIIVNKTVEVGQRVQTGQDLFGISQTGDIWVTADFKETQLKKMHAGQSADIHVDALGRTYHGYVESMPGATGARTSLLPPENATGNYVKVVQRLPVRIRLKAGEDSDRLLRIGMSVEPKVWLY